MIDDKKTRDLKTQNLWLNSVYLLIITYLQDQSFLLFKLLVYPNIPNSDIFQRCKTQLLDFFSNKNCASPLIFLLDHLLYYCIQYYFRQMENNKINKIGNGETISIPKKYNKKCNVFAAVSSFWICSISFIFISKHLLDVGLFFQHQISKLLSIYS